MKKSIIIIKNIILTLRIPLCDNPSISSSTPTLKKNNLFNNNKIKKFIIIITEIFYTYGILNQLKNWVVAPP